MRAAGLASGMVRRCACALAAAVVRVATRPRRKGDALMAAHYRMSRGPAPETARRGRALSQPRRRSIGARSALDRPLVQTVLAQVRAHVVALHAAPARHLADVSLRALVEIGEVALLERRDRALLGLGERGRELRRLLGLGVLPE